MTDDTLDADGTGDVAADDEAPSAGTEASTPSGADEIMQGVYRALCAHGYADLTMQDIADECDCSTSLLH